MKEKWKVLLPVVLLLAFALTRWPGVLPLNFSAAYAIVFCAGVYFTGAMAWWLPLGTLFVSDLLLNIFYYDASPISGYTLVNFIAFAGILLLARRCYSPRSSWVSLLGGGLLGAVLFYFITNTGSWLQNPAYAKTLPGWLQALTVGTPGWPHTWEFFRNTLLSGGLFTALFAGTMKISEALEKKEEDKEEAEASEPIPEDA